MSRRTLMYIFGAALLVSAAPVVSGAPQPGAAQTSTTTAKKKKSSSRSKKKGRVKGQTVPTPDRIKEIQGALTMDGSYQGEPTGKWDAATMEAMKKYQDKNGFAPTGKIDALSLNKMGLGSDTAGKGAPVPAASASHSASGTPADPPEK